MAWDWRRSAAIGACTGAYLAALSCNGAKFNSGSGGDAGASIGGSAGKAAAGDGTTEAGKGGRAGSSNGGTPGMAGDGQVDPNMAGEPNTGSAGDGAGGSQEPGFALPAEGLLYWFKSDVGVEIEAEHVVRWADQSPNGFDAVQLGAELRPTLTKSNLLPLAVVDFDGAGDHLELPELKANLSDGLSFFGVAGRSHDATCSPLLELSNGAEIDDVNFGHDGNALQYEVFTQTLTALDATFPVGEVRLIEAHHSGDPVQATVELRSNGIQVASTVMPTPVDVVRISNFIGRTLYVNCTSFSGGIAELILYTRKVTPDERTSIEQYLMNKWQCCK